MPRQHRRAPRSGKGDSIPHLALSHGQVIWLLTELGLCRGVSKSTFNHYVKSLRRLGIPFGRRKGTVERGPEVTYNFEDLMELMLALLLRVYGTLPDVVTNGLRSFREDLRPIYRQAYLDSLKRVYPAARVSTPNRERLTVQGLFLDLNIRYSAGQAIQFGPPRALSPFEAMSVFAQSEIAARSYLPLNMTAVAEMIAERTRLAPTIPRGFYARRRTASAQSDLGQ
jgi:AcrR family transcriptional regulator